MTNEEANKVIAEFMDKRYYTCLEWNKVFGTKDEPMGCNGLSFIVHDYYTKSLDALVPVLAKLEENGYAGHIFYQHIGTQIFKNIYNAQQAAAHATAKAIKELEG